MAHAVLHREAISRDLYLEAQQIWLELRAYPFGEGLLILMMDFTARLEEAERRNRIDRLESLGLLARGFAHDFNNLLTVLLGNLSLAELRLRGNTERLPELGTAKQATPMGGDLTIRCLAPNPEELYGGDMPPDMGDAPQGIIIEVKDTGEGIAPDHLPHIFEPYFSTRKAQHATGLGLTVCESIAKA